MEDLRWLSDKQILKKIGKRVKQTRLSIGATRASVCKAASVAMSTLEKIENGENHNLLSLIQVLRMLDRLDDLNGLAREEELSPIELEKILNGRKERKRGIKNHEL